MSEHRVTPRTYGAVFAALIVLTLATIYLANVELGPWHATVGFSIAAAKAVLIVLFFMHVLYSTRLTWAIVLSALFFLGILLVLTMTDYLTRGWQT